ncbi:MAG TPA: right-handed parallel beta-helix repeat-containing protein [Terracidiphilus sp.]|nr:right-handed parallel beta-helix repeat-containing protein [Terracidiphilus sp.]
MSVPVSNRPEFPILRSIFILAIALSPAMLSGQGSDPVPNYVVNTIADDATGTASNCTSSPEGICTLRDALAAANAVEASNITFDSTVFLATNSTAANTITLSNGAMNIPSGATITGLTSGSGATLTNLVTVSGNHASTIFAFAPSQSTATATIANLNIAYGYDQGGSKCPTNINCPHGLIRGGGIYNDGTLTVTGSTISNNSTDYYGGGIVNDPTATLTVIGSTFSNNVSNEYGGAILTAGTLTVTGSTFSNNSAKTANGGGIVMWYGTLTVIDSTFSGNSSGGPGGGIYNGSTVTVINSTFTGNSAGWYGGGGINNLGGTMTVTGSTFSNNSASPGAGIENYPGYGSLLALANDVLDGNGGDDLDDGTGNSSLPALIDSSGSCSGIALCNAGGNVVGYYNGNSINPAPISVAPLGNYGGPTQTMLPEPGSAAICGGIAANIPAGVTTDQRGYPIENTTYPGYSSSTPCVDSGAVQTNYAMAFTTQPPADAGYDEAIAPAPVVTLTESGNLAGAATSNVTMTDSSYALSGTTSESLSSGTATFPGLILSSPVTDDIFTATLGLNPMLNISAQASVEVSDTTTPAPATMHSPTPGTATILGVSNILFQWSGGAYVTSYELLIGTNGVGSSNILATAPLTTTSYTVPALPANGVTLYVRLGSLINGAWQTEDYQYTEATPAPAAMLSPTPGTATILGTSNILFQWSTGTDVTSYELLIGTSGVGSSNILNTGALNTTSCTVPALPANSVTLYVRLGSLINGAWQTEDYVYTESGPATLSPSSGTLSASQTFTWENGNEGATYYTLVVRSEWPGGPVLYNSGVTTQTSATVTIPANGATVVATLYQYVNGAWQNTVYTFAAPGTPTPATLSPSSGTLSTSQAFTWNNGNEAVYYMLVVRSEWPGGPVLLYTGLTTETSATVTIPANGATVVATLYQATISGWQETAYTFTAPGTPTPATLSPSSGTLSTSQTFTWGNGNEAVYYMLVVRSQAPGSPVLLATGETTETSATVTIPANGATIVATLYQATISGWKETAYTFTAP